MEDKNMWISLVAKLGIDLALVVLREFKDVTTIEQAIAKLETIKTSQEYVNEDAARRGITPKPLPPVT